MRFFKYFSLLIMFATFASAQNGKENPKSIYKLCLAWDKAMGEVDTRRLNPAGEPIVYDRVGRPVAACNDAISGFCTNETFKKRHAFFCQAGRNYGANFCNLKFNSQCSEDRKEEMSFEKQAKAICSMADSSLSLKNTREVDIGRSKSLNCPNLEHNTLVVVGDFNQEPNADFCGDIKNSKFDLKNSNYISIGLTDPNTKDTLAFYNERFKSSWSTSGQSCFSRKNLSDGEQIFTYAAFSDLGELDSSRPAILCATNTSSGGLLSFSTEKKLFCTEINKEKCSDFSKALRVGKPVKSIKSGIESISSSFMGDNNNSKRFASRFGHAFQTDLSLNELELAKSDEWEDWKNKESLNFEEFTYQYQSKCEGLGVSFPKKSKKVPRKGTGASN